MYLPISEKSSNFCDNRSPGASKYAKPGIPTLYWTSLHSTYSTYWTTCPTSRQAGGGMPICVPRRKNCTANASSLPTHFPVGAWDAGSDLHFCLRRDQTTTAQVGRQLGNPESTRRALPAYSPWRRARSGLPKGPRKIPRRSTTGSFRNAAAGKRELQRLV